MLVDSHCHLDFPDFADEVEEVVARAGRAGVGLMVSISTRMDKFEQLLALVERFPQTYCSVGVHPHEAASDWQADAQALIECCRHPKVVGIGETGLDYYYEHSPREAQQDSFRAHIAAARETGLPLLVHTRDADGDTAGMLAEEYRKGPFTGLIHCFSSSQELADKAIELGFYLSFSGILTFKKAEALRAVAQTMPLDRMLVETDAPYLAPVPMRGKRNEPSFVVHTAAAAAAVRGLDPAELARVTTDNFFRLFSKIPRDIQP
jgi:TatD DNase family protein